MDHRSPSSAPGRRTRGILLVCTAILAVATGLLLTQRPAATLPPSSGSGSAGFGGAADSGGSEGAPGGVVRPAGGGTDRPSPKRTVLDERDGVIPDGTTVSVFDDALPAVNRLEPGLLDALRRAAMAAESAGVGFRVNSGWRSSAYQQRLWQDGVAEHGSPEEAAKWVATPDTSAHVTGEAVDIGPSGATAWLSRHGAAYGLCQTYRNEPWHYELRPGAATQGCPRMYANSAEDPRMH